ncbi:uncharacterized protein LOC129795910 [Lutzomyia longipalpis]|uniref:uncharacterized protein LOC129790953 n=1 Tax=Lutzomyia longipalpis TaxID=7200 RepID=UPI002483C129|nr:uncharacterized protein LOC129790953 [Lutzomyia longipalpis]XP_055693435.1 uncharacterized protein LOC129795910 [Lutzomyia longipalpis]
MKGRNQQRPEYPAPKGTGFIISGDPVGDVPGQCIIDGPASSQPKTSHPKIHVVQANLHHCRAAMFSMDEKLAVLRGGVGLLQEPWVVRQEVKGINPSRGKLFYKKDSNTKHWRFGSC